MKYKCSLINSSKSIVELLPETVIEINLFNNLTPESENYESNLYHYYDLGIKKCNPKATLVGIDKFVVHATKAICSFEVERGLGNN